MRAGERLAMAVVLGGFLLVGSVAGAATYAWHTAGTVRVTIHDSDPEGTDVSIRVPGALVNAAIAICPSPTVIDDPDAAATVAALAVLADDLASMPDAVLLDVREAHGTRVRVEKSQGRILIRVRDTGENVEIDVPIGSVRRIASKLARAA